MDSDLIHIVLRDDDINFIIWCLGYMSGEKEKMDTAHQEFIKRHHDSIMNVLTKTEKQ